jgi:hypothetical protein
MVSAQTQYPKVSGKPFDVGRPINAPHTPQKNVVISAYSNQCLDIIFPSNILDVIINIHYNSMISHLQLQIIYEEYVAFKYAYK